MEKNVIYGALALLALCVAIYALHDSETENPIGASDVIQQAWEEWKIKYNKTYGGAEDKYRFQVFSNNYLIVQSENSNPDNTFTLETNKFADLTSEEFGAIYTGANLQSSQNPNALCATPTMATDVDNLPESVDWRTKGVLTPIKNQEQCGSCWAFSTVCACESLNAIDGNPLTSFSEQQLVDCSGSYGNFGCGGGWVQNAFHYFIAKGIMTEADYPYKGVDGKCQYDASKVVNWRPTGCIDVTTDNVDDLKAAVVINPTSVYIEADQPVFQLYHNGIINSRSCFAEGMIDHAVAAVGYTPTYWIVRNSWGADWGEQGYVEISTTQNDGKVGICGILSTPDTYATHS